MKSTRINPRKILIGLIAAMGCTLPAWADDHSLMRFPTLHGDQIAFESHGSIWSVSRSGGKAARLTAEPGWELMPRYSPDGKWIAFTGSYEGNRDVYVMPAGGGEAKRLTFHSDVVDDAPTRWGPDNMVLGWTPDSKQVLFLSRREAWNSWYGKLYSVPVEGGMATALPLDRGGLLSYSPDGKTIAYNRIFRNFRTWKRYDGGLAQKLFTYNFDSKQFKQITDWTGTETAPMWYGKTIYFLSDHVEGMSDRALTRRQNLWAYNTENKTFRQITHFADYDVDFPSLGDNGIVFQQGGKLYVLDLPTEQLHPLDVQVPDDGVHTRPRTVDAKDSLRDVDNSQNSDYMLSSNGKRVLVSARGDVFSLPVEHGTTRNLTESANADEDHPVWSPDGKTVAYTTDASGEQQLAIRPATGGVEKQLTHFKQGYLYQPLWSPGGEHLVVSDNEHRLWLVAVAGGEPKLIAQDVHDEIHDYTWSPDGRWVAYSLNDTGRIHSIWLYSLDTGKATRVSAGRDNDSGPIFDPEGKHLYFISNRHENTVPADNEYNIATLMSSGVYVTTLTADAPSLFAPRSDEAASDKSMEKSGDKAAKANEKGGDKADDKDGDKYEWKPEAIKPIHIDLDGLMARAVPVPGALGNITALDVRHGKVFYAQGALTALQGKLPGEKSTLFAFDIKDRKANPVVDDLDSYSLSADGEKLLYKKDKDWFVIDAAGDGKGKGKDDKKPLDLSHLKVRVDPRQEWREMFESAWRLQRDFYFNRPMNGVDWNAVRASYEKLLPLVGSREDLNYLIGEMIGEISNSHTYVGGGDQDNATPHVATALLGADLALDKATEHYYFAKIYRGDNTRDAYRSPLAEPGLNIHEGTYLLAVDGHAPQPGVDPYSLFVGKTDGTIRLTIADTANAKPRDVEVTPVKQELSLRENEHIEHNRALVDKLSGGRVAYIYLSDMGPLGMSQFVRQYYNQLDKQALVIDDRWNGGGNIDQIVLERLRRVLVGMQTNRQQEQSTVPFGLINGPKACLINSYSASDGDMFPFYFRKYGLGPLIGTRTWGGVRGIRGEWLQMDGGYITIPESALYGLDSQWVIENHGVEPDLKVEDNPADMVAGRDVQLETAVNYVLEQLKKQPGGASSLPPVPAPLPAYPPAGHE